MKNVAIVHIFVIKSNRLIILSKVVLLLLSLFDFLPVLRHNQRASPTPKNVTQKKLGNAKTLTETSRLPQKGRKKLQENEIMNAENLAPWTSFFICVQLLYSKLRRRKNTIRDGGSTAPLTAHTVYTAYTANTSDTAFTANNAHIAPTTCFHSWISAFIYCHLRTLLKCFGVIWSMINDHEALVCWMMGSMGLHPLDSCHN